jgi:opacity protein-like surface antigen
MKRSLPAVFVVSLMAALCIVSVVSVASAADAVSPERTGKLYWFGNLGFFSPQGDIDALNTGWNLSGGVGSRVDPNVALESSLSFLRSHASPGDVLVVPLTVGARLIYPTPVFEPYVGAGFGFYYVDLKKPGVNDTAFTLGGYLAGGADAWLNPTMAFNAELKYQCANPDLGGGRVDTSGVVFTLGVRMMF